MTSAGDLARRAEAQARRDAIDACGLCDETGFITGRQRRADGRMHDAAWRCDHTDRPLPAGFVPDPRRQL
ncbi:hypothetical protein KNT98_gp75 [Gordonia phage Frokostdame]|uniref:Uncharacterized protein n=1 Tax=Gordonia phage Frokostdame TaxID=2250320 RepID=A0A345L365_9CAUD|nr:hypothetical protein KNT98_gp75 [Gordonia phage Frokostdame]AXH49717.1 hypothetical protein SEA_FROKOSTDAME_75 [Gordonia phage Frokostdame]